MTEHELKYSLLLSRGFIYDKDMDMYWIPEKMIGYSRCRLIIMSLGKLKRELDRKEKEDEKTCT